VPQMIGTVNCLQVSDTAGFTQIRDAAGNTETFILWFLPGTSGGIPRTLNSFTRVLHSMWVSLLREAVAGRLTVRVSHPTNSSEVLNVQLG
jgi:hypothetical protein